MTMPDECKTYEEKIDFVSHLLREFDYVQNGALSSIGFLEIMKIELAKIEMEGSDEDPDE